MPGLLTPALCLGGGALIGIGVFVALNWDPICERFNQAVDEQRLYWEAIQTVRAQRREAQREQEKNGEDPEDEMEKAIDVFRATESSAPVSDEESAAQLRHRPKASQDRRESSEEPLSSSDSSPETFAVYTVVATASSDEEEADSEFEKSDENEFSSYDKLDASDLSSY